ncbi:class I SAM-dependent methyltransferase [Marinoscillum pacificum]|uniref:class I SAM-dependent methyltransferase n=1 Tax=Marinoscillum pacificum TaxID=392723 RepID=UPI0021580094|nr:class I SAM-dependent methyltransferase [Marinoscillum pacificum]
MADFDVAAIGYDEEFTKTSIGIAQRQQVWTYVYELIAQRADDMPLRVLELNCGTGEDARFFASKGCQVVATDVSEKMLEVAQFKNSQTAISFEVLDLNEIQNLQSEPFDLIFSNFGGLNCIAPEAMEKLGVELPRLFNPKGHFIAVVMPSFCLWESVYYLAKLSLFTAFRRRKKYVIANVSGQQVKTYYYSPHVFDRLINQGGRFFREKLKPIGLSVPPSYLENYFQKYPKILQNLSDVDNRMAKYGWQAFVSDHYLIQYVLK